MTPPQNNLPRNRKKQPNRLTNNPFVDADGAPLEEGDPVGELQQQAEDDALRNVPPHNEEAEQAVLGGILLYPDDVLDGVISIIKAEDFYIPANRLIYQACISLVEKGAPVNLKSVRIFLKEQNRLEEAGGAMYIAALAESVVSSARADYYASVVRDKAQLRSLIRTCSSIISNSFEPGLDTRRFLDESEQLVMDVAESKSERSYKSSAELVNEVFTVLDERAKHKGTLTGVNTGYRLLNSMTGGLQPSDLIILAARPSMGKTAFALNLAMNAAIGGGTAGPVPVAIFSLEMSMDQLMQRMLCAQGRVNLGKLRTSKLADEDWIKLQKAADVLSQAKLFIDDTPALSIMDLRARARRLKREKNIGMIVIDYLQLMRASRRVDSRELEISEISRGLKALAKELNIPVLALSQLNRKVEERKDKRPLLSDLRESGAIEQDADVIMFIYRASVYQEGIERPDEDVAEIILGKHRNGQVGAVELRYITPFTQFEDLVPEIQSPYSA